MSGGQAPEPSGGTGRIVGHARSRPGQQKGAARGAEAGRAAARAAEERQPEAAGGSHDEPPGHPASDQSSTRRPKCSS